MSIFANVKVGVAGWSYEDWKNLVYPAEEQNKLAYLAERFNCIEINSSFYQPPSARTADKWVHSVKHNESFVFSAKLWSKFTHDLKDPYPTHAEVEKTREGFRPLCESGRLQAILIQFPFYFRNCPESRSRLERIAEDFRDFPRVLAVRDASWATEESLNWISKRGFNIACLDMPLSKKAFRLKAVTTGPLAYLRLHGRNYDAWFSKEAGRDERYNYLYGKKEMDFSVHRIKELASQSNATTVIWNNHYQGKAVVNACELKHRLTNDKVDIPELLVQNYPRLKAIAM